MPPPNVTVTYTLALPRQPSLEPQSEVSLPVDPANHLSSLSQALLHTQTEMNRILTLWKDAAGANEVQKERKAEKAYKEAKAKEAVVAENEESEEEEDDRDEEA
jgi:hypothetical protein